MKVLVMYDSVFGNTEKLARAMGETLSSGNESAVLSVNETSPDKLRSIDLLIVGSPTRGFRPTEAIMNYLKLLPADSLKGKRTAAFDTRILLSEIKSPIFRFIVKKGGNASPRIAAELTNKGGLLVLPPEGFFVDSREGPTKSDELERAVDWVKQIVLTMNK